MIVLIAGASHTGKTALAQRLLENTSTSSLYRSFEDGAETILTEQRDDRSLTA